MKYGAITLDTSTFDRNGLKLSHGLLKTLDQFKNKPAGLLLSEIVTRELHSHLTKKASETKLQLERAFQDSADYLDITPEVLEQAKINILPPEECSDIAKGKLNTFVERTGAQIIQIDTHLDLTELIKRYFKSIAPFSDSAKKKNEFPDAMALLSLENYAKKKGIKILAVSSDNDWIEFAKTSEWIDVVKDLAEGIAAFVPQQDVSDFCDHLGNLLKENTYNEFYAFIDTQISRAVSEMVIQPEADCVFYWDPLDVEVKYKAFRFLDNDQNYPLLRPVQMHDDSVTIEAKVIIEAIASSEFSLYVYDSIDKDNVSMGYASKDVDFEFETGLLITIIGDINGGINDIEVDSVEILNFPKHIDFGTLEPDWWRRDDQ